MERRKDRFDAWKDHWIDRYFDLPCWDRAFLVGFLAALLGFALDEVAHLFGYPWYVERLVENAVEGFLIGCFVYWLSCLREKRMVRRMREIGFLNHHIRNAMQTIELAATEIADAQQRLAVIDQSVHRVVETLSRISRETDDLERESSLLFAG
jgi:hypothetical protein